MTNTHTADVTIDHEHVHFTAPDYELHVRLASITGITVDEEATAAAAEQELDVEKLVIWEPGLAKLLRFRIISGVTSFIFTIDKEQAGPVIEHFISKLPEDIFDLANQEKSTRQIECYPIHIHSCGEEQFA